MATIKKSNKKKIIIPIAIVLIIAILASSVILAKQKAGVEQVSLYTIATDTIVETVSATGEVSSGSSKEYKAGAVATCKKVYVKVGDEVSKGDKLASFDTTALEQEIKSMQASYDSTRASYNKAVSSEADARKKLAAVNKQIAPLEKKLAKMQKKKVATTTKKSNATTKRVTATNKAPTTQKNTVEQKNPTTHTTTKKAPQTTTKVNNTTEPISFSNQKVNAPGDYIDSGLDSVADYLKTIADAIQQLTDDVETMTKLLTVLTDTITDMLNSGEYSPDAIASACGDAMAKAIREGLIEETKLIIDSGIAIDMVETAIKSIKWDDVANSLMSTDSAQITSTQLQLAALYAERQVFTASANSTISSAEKQAMSAQADALEALKKSEKELKKGWVASMDGIITECNLKNDTQTTALETGIKLECIDTMIATISLGEYDIHKVKLGMQAKIKTAYGSYTGEVTAIAPTATGGSDGSMLDSVGSMAGISGLSSLTSSGAGVKCEVTIDSPDENIIVGFDADVEIQTGSYNDVPTVPIESIVLEKEGTYVYLYDEKENTVTKTKIETGAISDSAYEIKDGLRIGDQIVQIPASTYKEETFKVKVK